MTKEDKQERWDESKEEQTGHLLEAKKTLEFRKLAYRISIEYPLTYVEQRG